MSAGGVFIIITNDGKADKMLMATSVLEKRMKAINQFNLATEQAKSPDDPTKDLKKDMDATIEQIQQTHIIHYQSRFKPFVALGFEYQKIVPQAGGAALGSSVIFSLSQFGDFFTDMVLNVQFSTSSATAAPVPAVPVNPPNIVSAVNQINNTAVLPDGTLLGQIDPSNQTIRQFQYLGTYSYDGKLVNPGELYADNVYLPDFPGENMLQKVSFEINGNPLDDYDKYSCVFYRNFRLKADKRQGYYRAAGQELGNDAKSIVFADGLRYGGTVFSGLQTPKQVQPSFQVWQRLLFWFNTDQASAIPSAAIPFGQRYVRIDFEQNTKMLYNSARVYNVLKTTDQYVPGTVFSLQPNGQYDLSGANLAPVRNTVYKYFMLPVTTGGALNYPSILNLNLYVNNIFTHSMIHDLYIKRIGFSLVRLHKRQATTINQAESNQLMNQFKFPIEYIYCGLLPSENIAGPYQGTDWHQFSKITHKFTTGAIYLTPEANSVFDSGKLLWSQKQRTIDSIEVTTHGVSLYQRIDQQFYNQYLPLVFGDHTIVTPDDQGLAFINFALQPGIFQPSGHINVSRAREFYIRTFSSNIGVTDPVTGLFTAGQLITEAVALNFLLVSDGSAVLRYST